MRFDTATKRVDETFTLFAARLRNNLRYYLRSRNCLDDFERLFALLIADKLKSCLTDGVLNYALSLEGNECFGPGKIAELADTYVSNHGDRDKTRRPASADRTARAANWLLGKPVSDCMFAVITRTHQEMR